jgi:gluconokinase
MVLILMGVAGSGKTTIGQMLARALGWRFVEGDDFHSPANVAKMAAGIPLTDADRVPWLAALHNAIAGWVREQQNIVLASSALKRTYRATLKVGPEVIFAYLRGSPELIARRIEHRRGHYMKANLLPSQFEILEEPEDAITVEAALPEEEIVRQILAKLDLKSKLAA